MAVEIGLHVDFGREATARATERLTCLPLLAPTAETWTRTKVLSNICAMCAVDDSDATWSKKASNTPALLGRSKCSQMVFRPVVIAARAIRITVLGVALDSSRRSCGPLLPSGRD